MNPRWLALCLGMILLTPVLDVGAASPLAATEAEVPMLFPEQEKVIYLPIAGSSAAVEEVRQKEVHGITRFFRKEGLVASPVVTSAMEPELFLQVEPMLMLEARQAACQDAADVSPEALLLDAQARFSSGDVSGARDRLARAREALPCWQVRASRSFAAEFLVWSGLTAEDPESDVALGLIRAGLSTDPLLTESPKLPDEALQRLHRVYADMEYLPQVDLHLPQGRRTVWARENLILNGRRLVLDKLFMQLPPGIHFLQILLPDGQLWGTFLDMRQGGNVELAAIAREAFGLLERYRQALERVLAEGWGSPGLMQGFKVYSVRIARESFYLAGITLETDGPWITVRRYHMDRGIEVPEAEALKTDGGYTASVPIVLSRPWSVDLSAGYSGLWGQEPSYFSHGSGLTLELTYQVTPRVTLGAFGTLGGRVYRMAAEPSGGTTVSDVDVSTGATVGVIVPLGTRLRIVPDVGLVAHVTRFRGLPVSCVAGDDASSFSCTSVDDAPDSFVFNLRAKGSGPLVRLALQMAPFGEGAFTLRSMLRVGYSPLLVFLPESATVMVTTEDAAGIKETTAAAVSLDPDSQLRLMHLFVFSAGLHGTY